ncbi:MAG: hypothetical protein ACOYJR_07280 [Acutalibacteraceae bacterium]|jgi:hypothetical protein
MKKLRKTTFFASAAAILFLLCSCGSPFPDPAPVSSLASSQGAPSSSQAPSSSDLAKENEFLFVNRINQLNIDRSDTSLEIFSTADGEVYLRKSLSQYLTYNEQSEPQIPEDYLKLFDGLESALQSGTDIGEPLLLKMNLPEKMSLLTPYLCVGESNRLYYIGGTIPFQMPEHVTESAENRCIYREYLFENKIVQAESNGYDSFLLTEQGELFCLGTMSLYGGWAVVPENFYFKPVKVQTPGKVKKIVLNERTLYLLCEDGVIYSAPSYTTPEGYGNEYNEEAPISPDRNVFSPIPMDAKAIDLQGGGMNFCIMALDEKKQLYLYLELEDFYRVTDAYHKDPSKPKQPLHPAFEKVPGIGAVQEIRTDGAGNRILLKMAGGGYQTLGYLELDSQTDRLKYVSPTPVDGSLLPENAELHPFCGGILAVPAQGENLYSGMELSINNVYFLPRAAAQFVPAEKVYWKLFD